MRPSSVDRELQAGVHIGYRAELDGLRAVAVLAVVLYHFHGPSAPILGGFLGVDLFFVLSGFLITRLLLEEDRGRGSISLRSFYRRRMARLFPALALVLAFVALDAVTIGSGGPSTQLFAGIAATVGYSANWLWGTGHAFGTLDAMWSLSMEEQFYVVWPLAFLLIMRRGTIRTVRWVALAVSLFGAVDMFVRSMAGNRPDLIYASTDAHGALAIGTGCALAAWWPLADTALESPIGRAARWLMVPSLAFLAVVLTSVDYRSTFMFRGGFALAAASIAMLLVNALAGRASLAPLRLAPLVWLGRLSYGMYLWHLPIYSLVGYLFWRVHATTYLLRVTWLVALAATVATAAASYYAVERPMRRRLSPPRPVLTEDVSATTTASRWVQSSDRSSRQR